MKNCRGLMLLAMVSMIGACAHPTVSAVDGDRAAASQLSVEDYKLGIDDRVRVIVFEEPSLSGEFQVGADGNLAFPLVGTIPSAGHTTSEITAAYKAKLADGYLVNPRVSMEIISYRPFFILGEVRTPGKYPYAAGLTVVNAIATASGFTPRGEKKIVFIRRSGEAMEKPYELTADLVVLPGDTIRIGERFF